MVRSQLCARPTGGSALGSHKGRWPWTAWLPTNIFPSGLKILRTEIKQAGGQISTCYRVTAGGQCPLDTGMECQQTQVAALGRVRTRWTGFLFFGLAAPTIEHSCGFGNSQLNI